ncbi:MAG: PfkB family carbohydrate kinase, partial [Candidatus Cloacimonadaceae bacterium]|nr:PfkB family carbohydrate kinase [Candidatus Cloacimonadaceae bacterium]
MVKPKLLCIAALDSSGGAGLNQDMRVCSLLGEEHQSVCTGITIQDDSGVVAVHPTADHIFAAQLDSVLAQGAIPYVKIGAICSATQIALLHAILKSRSDLTVIIDPVLRPTLGIPFIREDIVPQYLELLEHAHYLCPNYAELAALSGIKVDSFDDALAAAKELITHHDIGILVKGGHSDTPEIREAYISQTELYSFSHPRYT